MEQLATQGVNSELTTSAMQLMSKVQSLSAKVKTLERELYYYKKTSRDLKRKLQTLKGKTREEAVNKVGSSSGDGKSEIVKEEAVFQLSAPLQVSAEAPTDSLGIREGTQACVLSNVGRETGLDDVHMFAAQVVFYLVNFQLSFHAGSASECDSRTGFTHSRAPQIVSSEPRESHGYFEEGQTREGGEERLADSLEAVQMREMVGGSDGRVSGHFAGEGTEGEMKQLKVKGRREEAITASASRPQHHGSERMPAVSSSCMEFVGITTEEETVWKSRKQLRQLR